MKDSDLPNFKDQVASVSADGRPLLPHPDDDDATNTAAAFGEASLQVETVEPASHPTNSNKGRIQLASTRSSADDANPSLSATSATQLPMAVAVFGDEEDNSIGGNGSNTDNNNTDERTNGDHEEQQKHFYWMTAMIVMVVAAAVVGGVCGSGSCGGGTPVEAAPMLPSSRDNTTPSPATAMPLFPPTISPADVADPTPDPLPAVTNSTREQSITIFINENSNMGVYLSPTGSSPEERALQWLIYEDPLQLNAGAAEADEFRLLQRYSLLTLWFQAKTGTAWSKSTNWINADECTWYRIVCNDARVVQRILLFGLQLRGTLSPDLGLLSDLTVLNLNSNSLTGSLPSEIGLWLSMTNFNVSSNFLTGSLPSQIGSWTNITYFDVSRNGYLDADTGITGSLPTEIGLWTKLSKFYVEYNEFTGSLPSEIGLWTNLTHFDVYFNGLNGTLPSEIGSWASLRYFSIGNNYLSGSLPSEIGLWTNMQVVSIYNNRLNGSWPSEMGLWKNVSFFTSASNLFTGTLPSEIGLWTSLTLFAVLRNSHTGAIPETIANWTLIEFASFHENNFTGSVPDSICDFISGEDTLTANCELPCSCCTSCT